MKMTNMKTGESLDFTYSNGFPNDLINAAATLFHNLVEPTAKRKIEICGTELEMEQIEGDVNSYMESCLAGYSGESEKIADLYSTTIHLPSVGLIEFIKCD